MPEIDVLVYDVGSTYTKATALHREGNKFSFLGRSQAPTTVQDVETGVNNARNNLVASLGWEELSSKYTLATSSAAGGLRMVAIGFMPRVTAKAAKEVAMNAGARVLEIITCETPIDFRLQMLLEIRPDIILLAGGTDGGDQDSVLENANIIVKSTYKGVVIIACNVEAQPKTESILTAAGIRAIRVANVMPTIHELNVKPARAVIHQEFIRQITQAKGLGKILDMVSTKGVMPTPGAVLVGAELLALGTHEQEGTGGLLVIDIGGATTDIHSVIPELDELSNEEKGLVISNEKQVSFRTVEGNLGLRVSATGIVATAGAAYVLAKAGVESEEMIVELNNYAKYLEANPEHISSTEKEKLFDKALAITAIELALKRHAGYVAQSFDPVLGVVPGVPVGRDLRRIERVIAVGGIFAHSDELESKEILEKAFANPGISLLPVNTKFIVDKHYLLYSVGATAEVYPNEALALALESFSD